MSEGEATVDGEKSEGHLWDEVINLPETVYLVENHDSNPPDGNRDGNKVEVSTDAEQPPVVRKPISANPRLNRPNPQNKFILRLNSVPRSMISALQGIN